ncbi:MAG: hypothetical protein AAF380_01140 [Bacteroidota bacterium]
MSSARSDSESSIGMSNSSTEGTMRSSHIPSQSRQLQPAAQARGLQHNNQMVDKQPLLKKKKHQISVIN